jgi:uncharacterized protein (TIGR03086 family)
MSSRIKSSRRVPAIIACRRPADDDEFPAPASSSVHMSAHPDLRPAARRLAALVERVPDGALDHPTPCTEYTVGDLVEHAGGLALAFAGAATKHPLDGAARGDARRLPPDWRTRIPSDLLAMAEAWQDPDAWTGMTAAGGVDLPGEVAGVVALDELVIHGWDLAKATGQPAGYDGPGLEAVHALVEQFRAAGVEGIFGPPVDVPEDAPLHHRTLALTGRDPGWAPPG